jgi:transposase
LQAHETKNRRLCYRQKKTKQRPPSQANKTRQTQHIATSRDNAVRRDYGYFTTKRLKVFARFPTDVSDETVRRVFRANGFKYTHSRKKGVLSRRDMTIRLKFAKQVRSRLNPTVWTKTSRFIWTALASLTNITLTISRCQGTWLNKRVSVRPSFNQVPWHNNNKLS